MPSCRGGRPCCCGLCRAVRGTTASLGALFSSAMSPGSLSRSRRSLRSCLRSPTRSHQSTWRQATRSIIWCIDTPIVSCEARSSRSVALTAALTLSLRLRIPCVSLSIKRRRSRIWASRSSRSRLATTRLSSGCPPTPSSSPTRDLTSFQSGCADKRRATEAARRRRWRSCRLTSPAKIPWERRPIVITSPARRRRAWHRAAGGRTPPSQPLLVTPRLPHGALRSAA
mmetsp:Transcript_37921/g.104669  ORF Transcript_37921/g.104669 Transcript_37921/m.104669 type:complete len:227 (+) Transcript_37921:469-1149(+)